MNTFNYNKHNNIDNTNNYIQKIKTQEHWVLPLDQMRFGPASRPTSFGSYGSTQALAPAKNPKDLAPDAGLKQNES